MLVGVSARNRSIARCAAHRRVLSGPLARHPRMHGPARPVAGAPRAEVLELLRFGGGGARVLPRDREALPRVPTKLNVSPVKARFSTASPSSANDTRRETGRPKPRNSCGSSARRSGWLTGSSYRSQEDRRPSRDTTRITRSTASPDAGSRCGRVQENGFGRSCTSCSMPISARRCGGALPRSRSATRDRRRAFGLGMAHRDTRSAANRPRRRFRSLHRSLSRRRCQSGVAAAARSAQLACKVSRHDGRCRIERLRVAAAIRCPGLPLPSTTWQSGKTVAARRIVTGADAILYRGMDRAQLDAAYNNCAAVPSAMRL
jgi:hypothetical protein